MSHSTKIAIAAIVVATGLLFAIPSRFSNQQLHRGPITRGLANAKQIGFACKLYAADHHGAFPNDLNELVPDYLPDKTVFSSPLAPKPGQIDYDYFGAGTKDTDHRASMNSSNPDEQSGPVCESRYHARHLRMKSSRLRILALALLPVFGASGKESTPPIPAKFQHAAEEAKKHFERGNFREAEKIYETIVAAAPKSVYALSNLGVVRFRLGKLKRAEEAFRRAINVAPNDAYSHMILGIIYYSQSRYDEAIAPLKRTVELEPNNATAHNYLGCLYTAVGMAEEAAKEFEIAKKLDPKYGEAPAAAPPPKELRIHEA